MTQPAAQHLSDPPAATGLLSLRRVRWGWVVAGAVLSMAVGMLYARTIRSLGDWEQGLHWERSLLLGMERRLPWLLDQVFLTVPWAGTNLTVMPEIVVFVLWLAVRRKRLDLAAHLLTVAVGSLIFNAVLKDFYDRPRPSLWEKRGQFAWASFPSGHAIVTISVIFTVAVVLHREKGWRWPYAVAVLLLLISFYSRLYLGVHWPTDIIGGALVGAVWFVTTLVAFAPGIPSERRRSDDRRGDGE
jgi:membrane-associated phospholipid phosphatase